MNNYGSYCRSHEHVELSIETMLGQSSYLSQIGHFCPHIPSIYQHQTVIVVNIIQCCLFSERTFVGDYIGIARRI